MRRMMRGETTMARKRRGTPIHGWIVLDKPLGLSSSQAVGAVRRITGAAKAGHGGTLDPLATGILPIALGEATKTVAWAMAGRKTYRFRLRWGEARSTDDAEGEIVATSTMRPAARDIEAHLPRFTGTILQVPPRYSALKVDGRRAYALARAGETVALAARPVEIRSCRFRNGDRQGRLRPRARSRPRRGARHRRACRGVAPPRRRAVHPRPRDFAR
jgi:tRNA pseudouridine55 synthase